jgi:hypothetical protein
VIVAPFRADHDHAIAPAHLAVGKIAILVFQKKCQLESEGVTQEFDGGPGVLVEERGGDRGMVRHELRLLLRQTEIFLHN